MPWDNTYKWIVGAVNTGDVSNAIGVCSSDVGTLCSSNLINPLALWKPFRSSAKGFANATEQRAAIRAARCGFSEGPYGLPIYYPAEGSGTNIPHAVWTYQLPRGKGGGDNGEDEWYRLTDFSPVGSTTSTGGYYAKAVMPISVLWPHNGITSGNNSVTLLADGNLPAYWRQNFCMSFEDMIPTANYGNYKFALVFQSDAGMSVIVSNTTVSSFVSGGKAATITFDPADVQGIKKYGDLLTRCSFGLVSSSHNAGIYNGGVQFSDYVLSLEVKRDCDRQLLKYIGQGSIEGMTGTATVTLGSKTTYSQYGFSCYYPIQQVSISISSVNAADWISRTSVNLRLDMYSTGAMGTASGPGSPFTMDFSRALSTNQTKTYTLDYGVDGFNPCAFVPSSANGQLSGSLYAQNYDGTWIKLCDIKDSNNNNPIPLPR